jgi:hypothetical protein
MAAAPGAAAKAGRSKGGSESRPAAGGAIASAWLADDDLRTFLGVHDAGGTTWLRAEPLATLAAWTSALTTAEGGDGATLEADLARALEAAAQSGYAVDRWLAALAGRAGERPATEPAAATGSRPRKPGGRRGDRNPR